MDIRLPNLGEGADSGTVVAIFVKAGDVVSKDQPLIELESEKAVAAIPSPASGTVARVHVAEGDEIRVGALIVSLAGEAASGEEPAPETPAPKRGTLQGVPKPESPPSPPVELPEGVRPGASPSIRRMARELGIDLGRIRGTGRGGRIVLGDLRDYIARLQQGEAITNAESRARPPRIDFSRWGPIETERATSLRKTIATRMVESWTTIPHVTQFADADITGLMSLRKRYAPEYREKNARLTLTPILLKAVARTLQKHPIVNSSWIDPEDDIVLKKYVHIGVAVDTEHGLIVPVIREVDRKNVLELAREIEDVAERTRARKISKEQMQGATFTVSNQGGIGGAHFTPIINKPEVAILGVGRGRALARKTGETWAEHMMLPLALSHDHRLIDGAQGVRFLVDLVEAIERFPESDLQL